MVPRRITDKPATKSWKGGGRGVDFTKPFFGFGVETFGPLKPGETGLFNSSLLAHLKADRAIMVGVKGIEEESSIGAGVCG